MTIVCRHAFFFHHDSPQIIFFSPQRAQSGTEFFLLQITQIILLFQSKVYLSFFATF